MYTGFEAAPHTDIFVTLGRSHTINRLSRSPSVALLFMGFRAIRVPVTGDDPVQNLGAIRRLPWYIVCRQRPLVFAPTDYCKPTGDKPLRNRGCFRHLSYFTSTRSAHVVTMAVISNLITFLKGDADCSYIFISDHRIRTNPLRIELRLAVLETAVILLH